MSCDHRHEQAIDVPWRYMSITLLFSTKWGQMSRRKTFDPGAVPLQFWRRDDVRLALARREVGRLFGIYLGEFPTCTQAQLALLTEHDRSDVSNFVRGTRSSRVTDIDVLNRIADGLAMPDEARTLIGLAPAKVVVLDILSRPRELDGEGATTTGWYRPISTRRPLRVAICGSRSVGSNDAVIDNAVHSISRLLMNHPCQVAHGPMGIGIEIMTYIADHYRPPKLLAAVGIFGRPNILRNADFVIIVGGGYGTLDEVDLAISMSKQLIPFAGSGGAARHAFERMSANVELRAWLPQNVFTALGTCTSGDEYAMIVEQLFVETGSASNE